MSHDRPREDHGIRLHGFRVWAPDDGDRPETGPNIRAYCASAAAKDWVERNWSDLDNCESIDVRVEDEVGKIHDFTVDAEQTVSFSAFPMRMSDAASK